MTPASALKHALAILALVGVSATVAGCGTVSDGEEAVAPSGAVESILFDFPFTSLPFYDQVTGYAQARAKEKGVQLTLTNDNTNLADQITNLTTGLTGGFDAVVSFPLDPASVESIAQQYRDAGTWWVTYGGDIENQDATLQFSFVESGRMLGQEAGEWASSALGRAPKVLVIEDQSLQIGRERTQGIVEGLRAAAPGAQIVAQQQGITPDDGLSVTTAALAANPDIDIVLAASGGAADGAYRALVAAGRAEDDPSTFVGGVDGDAYGLKQVAARSFYRAVVTVSAEAVGNAVVDVPLALAAGRPAPSVDLPVELVTADSPELKRILAEFGVK